MAAGDVEVYVGTVDDDGTKLDAVLTGNGIVVADSVSMCHLGGNKVAVLVIKAA